MSKYNQLIGFVLIFAILVGFAILSAPSKEDRENARRRQDSLEIVQREKDSIHALITAQKQDSAIALQPDSSVGVKQQPITAVQSDIDSTSKYSFSSNGVFYTSLEGDDSTYIVETDLMKIKFASKGAAIKQIELKEYLAWDKKPLNIFYKENNFFEVLFHSAKSLVNTSELYFQPVSGIDANDTTTVLKSDSLKVVFGVPAMNEAGSEVGALLFSYTFFKDSYMFDFNIGFKNREQFLGTGSNFVTVNWNSDLASNEKSISNERNASTVHYADNDLETDYLSETKNDEENIKTSLKWVSYKQQFFATSIIAKDKFSSGEFKTNTKDISDSTYLKSMYSTLYFELDKNKDSVAGFSFYAGPTKYKILRSYHLGLERQIPLGWSFAPIAWINRYAVIPVFNWLEGYNINYGIIILILTILLKIVLFPIARKTYKNSAKMRVLKPDIDVIAAKYPKPEDAMKKQQATMELYKKAGVSPLSGCIPMLLQFPILIAMFRFFPASIELRQQPFLWAEDLSSYDSILELGFNIPFYGDHVSLFCLLMTISTVIYTRINEKMMAGTNKMPGMRLMLYLMPLMFLGFFNSYASGLSYYYLLANLITFAQMFAFRYTIDEKKLHALIEENKKKPVKKSNWQKRIEQAQKMAKERQKR